jgi:thioesterase domain-containing protein
VPGHAGDVFSYRALALHIGDDQPFFGLEPPGLDGNSAPLERVEELAEYFAAQILEFHPEGPCIIAGHCAGGAIAFELARQLQTRGTEVRMLVLFACPYPAYYGFVGQLRQKVRLESARIYRHVRTLMTLSLPGARRYVAAKLQRLKLQRDIGRAAATDPVLIRRAAVMRATVAAVCRYIPGNYAGPVSMILPNCNWLHSGAEPLRWQSEVPQADVCFGPESCDPDLLLVDPDAPAIADLFRLCRDRQATEVPLARAGETSVRGTARVAGTTQSITT